MTLEKAQGSNLRAQSYRISCRRFIVGNPCYNRDRIEADEEDFVERTSVEETDFIWGKRWVEMECATSGIYQVVDVDMA